MNLPPSLPEEEPDETNEFGRYTARSQPVGEDELYALILRLVRQACGAGAADELDSWGISAFEAGIEALQHAGFAEIEPGHGRMFAKLTPMARKFEAWIEFHDRPKRVAAARHRMATNPGLTPEVQARAYDITLAELLDEAPEQTSHNNEDAEAERRAANIAQAKALREQAQAGGLRFMAYLPPDLAGWMLDLVKRGVFADPSEAAFVMLGEQRELEPHVDLRTELQKRMIQAAIDDPRPSVPHEEVVERMRALAAAPGAEPAMWRRIG